MHYQPLHKTLNELRERMKKHPTAQIARVSGVDIKTCRAIRNGLHKSPTVPTLNKIGLALDSVEGVEND